MKVIHLVYNDDMGGQQTSIVRLCEALNRVPGIEAALGFCSDVNMHSARARNLGIKTHSFHFKFGQDISALLRTRAVLADYDVHHFHNVNLPLLLSSISVSNATRIFTERGGRLAGHGLKGFLFNPLYGFLLRHNFDAFSANTKYGCQKLKKVYGITSRTFVTYNGVNFDSVKPELKSEEVGRRLGIQENDFVIGSVGRLAMIKRFDRLIKAMPDVAGKNIKCLIVGDGPEREPLENLALKLGVSKHVIFTGLQMNPYDYVNIMDLFVLPTLEGGFENALVEAMYMGVPGVVYKDGGGVVEHISDGLDGFVIQKQKELVNIIINAQTGRCSLKEIGRRASAKVQTLYSINKYVEGYLKVYRELGVFN